jgi:prepilin-type N-terminal cleavage/methylation domain-containing protein
MSQLRWRRTLADQSGFTLIELLAVALILVVLALLALPVYAEVTDKVRTSRSQADLTTISGMLDAYQADHGHYPMDLQRLVDAGYLKSFSFESPWSSPPHNPMYYYYWVNKGGDDAATRYVLAAPGPLADCPALGCSNNPNGQAPINPDERPTPPQSPEEALTGWLSVRGSH